jgi:hypothetical protein
MKIHDEVLAGYNHDAAALAVRFESLSAEGAVGARARFQPLGPGR